MSYVQPRRRWGRITALVGAGAALLLSGMAPVSANEGLPFSWNLPAVDISEEGAYAPRLAIGPEGTAAVAWVGTAAIQVAVRAPGASSFGSPVTVSNADDTSPIEPEVAVGPAGEVTVTWASNYSYGTPPGVIRQATKAAESGSFSQPSNVSTAGGSQSPQLAYGPGGDLTIVWGQQVAPNMRFVVKAATRAVGASTFAPVAGSESGELSGDYAFPTGVVYLPDGATTVAWERFDGTGPGICCDRVEVSTRLAGASTFAAPETLSAAGKEAEASMIAAGPNGATVVAWDRTNDSEQRQDVQLRTRAAVTDPFNTVVELGSGVFPQAAYGPNGDLMVAWLKFNGNLFGPDADVQVQVSSRTAGAASFGAAVPVSAAGGQIVWVDLAVASDGTVTTVWRRTAGGVTTVQAATRPVGSAAFDTPQDLTSPGQLDNCVVLVDAVGQKNREPDVSTNAYVVSNWCRPYVAFGSDNTVTAVWPTAAQQQVTGSPSAMAPVPTGKIQAATGVVPIPAPTPTPTPEPTPEPISGKQASLKVKALGKKKKLSVGETTKVVRKVKTDAKIKKVQTKCFLQGQKLTGKDRKQLCGIEIKRNKKKNAKVWVTPACSTGLKYTTKITANGQGVTKNTWQRTWKVKNKPRISCALRGTG